MKQPPSRTIRDWVLEATEEDLRAALGDEEFDKLAQLGKGSVERALTEGEIDRAVEYVAQHTDSHMFCEADSVIPWRYCRRCMRIWNEVMAKKPCKGPSKLGLR